MIKKIIGIVLIVIGVISFNLLIGFFLNSISSSNLLLLILLDVLLIFIGAILYNLSSKSDKKYKCYKFILKNISVIKKYFYTSLFGLISILSGILLGFDNKRLININSKNFDNYFFSLKNYNFNWTAFLLTTILTFALLILFRIYLTRDNLKGLIKKIEKET